MKKIKLCMTILMIGFTGLYTSCNQPTNTPVQEVPAETTEETAEEAEKRRQEFLEWVEGEWIDETRMESGENETLYLFEIKDSMIIKSAGYAELNFGDDWTKIKTYSESKDKPEWDWEGTSKVLVDKKTAFFIKDTGCVYFINKINENKFVICSVYIDGNKFSTRFFTNKKALTIKDDNSSDTGNNGDSLINIEGTWKAPSNANFAGTFTFNSDNTWTFSGDKAGQPSDGTFKIDGSTLTMEYTLKTGTPVTEDFTVKTVTETSMTLVSKNYGVSTTFSGYFGVTELEMTFTKE